MKNSKKTIYIIVLLTCVGFISSKAQDSSSKFGIKGGINFSNLYTENVDDTNVLMGFNLGVFAKLPITNSIAIEPELYYTTKGAEVIYNTTFVSGTSRFKLNYIEVPILLVINVTENFNIHAGPYAAYLVSAKTTNESDGGTFDFENDLNTDDYNTFDAGIAVGIGVDVKSLSFGLRYNYGLTKVGKERNYSGTNYSFPDAKNSVLNVYTAFLLN
jgi:hypothetical protein